jgi:hypothetical protein
MNIFKSLLCLLLIFDLFIINCAYIQLYNTEDALAIQSYDCIYYTNVTARNNETTPYCIRTKQDVSLNRSFTTNSCENSGKEWSFKNLKQMNIAQDEVLTWNSSIEMADRYAAYLITGYVSSSYCLVISYAPVQQDRSIFCRISFIKCILCQC